MKLLGQVFLLSIALTVLLTGITFPIHMGLLLYYLPEEIVDKTFIFNATLMWLIIFIILIINVKRENKK